MILVRMTAKRLLILCHGNPLLRRSSDFLPTVLLVPIIPFLLKIICSCSCYNGAQLAYVVCKSMYARPCQCHFIKSAVKRCIYGSISRKRFKIIIHLFFGFKLFGEKPVKKSQFPDHLALLRLIYWSFLFCNAV